MPKLVVSLAGHPGSGKTSAVDALERDHDFEPVRPSRMIRSYADEHGIALGADRSLWAEARRRLGRERGPDWLTQAIFASTAEKVALDGLRTVGDYNKLRHAAQTGLTRVAFVGLFCPPEIRFNNTITGEGFDKDKSLTLEDFLAQELPEYYSDDEYGVSTDTILNLTPPELRITYTTEPKEEVQRMIMARLAHQGFLKD